MIELITIKLIAFLAIFYKLVVTNHWSTGKKLLVALSAGLVIESTGTIACTALGLGPLCAMLTMIPLTAVAVSMCYMFYRKDFIY